MNLLNYVILNTSLTAMHIHKPSSREEKCKVETESTQAVAMSLDDPGVVLISILGVLSIKYKSIKK